MLSTEGVMSHVFYRWATDADIHRSRLGQAFYAQFGVTVAEVSPLQNAYLKMLHVFQIGKPQNFLEFVEAYLREIPADAPAVRRIINEATCGVGFTLMPEVWVSNPSFTVGTSVFDQYRALPRVHAFDLNAASLVDLCSIPGVTPAQASQILLHQPFESLEAFCSVVQSFGIPEQSFGLLKPVDQSTKHSPEDIIADLFSGWEIIMRSYDSVRS
jgi:hypothetical protein